jgi:hypothetical protein
MRQPFGKQIKVDTSVTLFDKSRALINVLLKLISKFLHRPNWQPLLRFVLDSSKMVKVMHRSIIRLF